MNRIYKVIYSKARQCYIVVSELAKSNHKSSQQGADHTNTPALARIIAVALAAGALTWGSVPGVSWAAPASDKGAIVFDDKDSLKSTDAQEITHNLVGYWGLSEGQSIALGKGAHAWMQAGGKAYGMLFGMTKAAGAIAIGEGSEALSQSIDIGNRTYTGAIGDVTISNYSNIGDGSGVGSVLLGTNSYTGGTLSTLIGDYSIISTAYPHGYDGKEGSYLQNAGAVSVGALNSIESATSGSDYSGVANSIVGLANKTNNANGALIYGAGNEITNSNASISTPVPGFGDSAKSAADSLRDSVKENPGGAVLAIGGGNKADWTQRTQIIGVANTVQGLQDKPSIYNMVDGYNTTLNNSSHVYTIGYRNDFNNENNSVVIGDYHQMTNGKNNVVIGSYDGSYDKKTKKTTYLTNDNLVDAVMIGHNADVQKNGGVALGAGSVASVDKASTDANAIGYDPATKKPSTVDSSTWKSTAAAVSVGDASKNITRQITNVAAGTQDTDAVNVAQLKKAMETAQASANDTDTHVKAGTYAVTTVKDAAGKDTQGVALDVVDKTGTPVGKVTITDVAKASDVGNVSQLSKEVQNAGGSTTVVDAINIVNTKVNTVVNKVGDLNYSSTHYVKSGDNVTTSISNLDKAIHDATTEVGKHSTVSAGNNIKVTPDTTDGKTDYKVSLSDDINVNSVTAKTVTTDNLTVNKSATIGKVTINADDKGTISGLTNKTWDAKNITSGQAATEDQLQAATKNVVNYDGDSDNGKTITLREDTTIKNVANTTIEQGSKNAVNAGTVYNETRVKQDGKYVKASNTAGENLSVLDNQVASNSSNITNLNGRVNSLDSKVNKVGAGAAALAALHPLDFDPEDKWDFAVGYGNYRDANSVAVGAFYRPDDDTMFSVGTNFGNGENMINAGVSFKFGPKGKSQVRPGSTQEITELRATVARQDDQLKKQDNEIKELKAMVQQLMAKQDKQATTK